LTRRGDEGTSAGELDVVGLEVDGADGVVEDGTGRIDASAGAGLVAFEGHSVELDALDPYSGEYGRVELQFVGDVTTRGDET
jgi:hypothetical protein